MEIIKVMEDIMMFISIVKDSAVILKKQVYSVNRKSQMHQMCYMILEAFEYCFYGNRRRCVFEELQLMRERRKVE